MFGTKSLIKEVKRKGYNSVPKKDWEPFLEGDILSLEDGREVKIIGELGDNYKLQSLFEVFLFKKKGMADSVRELYRKELSAKDRSIQ